MLTYGSQVNHAYVQIFSDIGVKQSSPFDICSKSLLEPNFFQNSFQRLASDNHRRRETVARMKPVFQNPPPPRQAHLYSGLKVQMPLIVLPACSILATALSAALNASVAFFV